MKKRISWFLIISLIVVADFMPLGSWFSPEPIKKGADKFFVKEARAAVNEDGMIFYGVSGNTTPQMRAYDTTANAFDPASGTVAGAAPVIARMKASPAKNEYIAAYQDATGNLRVMCYDGANWSNEWSIAVAPSGTPTTRRFDIAYETTTGDVTVLYSRNTAATNALAYRTKSGASGCGAANWTAAVNMPTTTTLTTGTIQWVKAVRDGRDGSNLDAFIWAGSNSDLGAAIWSGSTFTNLKLLETNLERISVSQDVDSFDLAYESSSGDLMVVWGSGGSATVNGAYYNTCTGGASSCTWTAARTAIPSLANDATVLDLAADPTSDRMSFSSIGNGGSDLQAAYWNGGSWTGYNDIDASCETPLAGMRLTQTGWLTNNGITKWFLTYDDSTGTGISWFATTPGVALVKQSDWAATPSINDIRGRYELDENPYDSSEIMLTLSDSTNSVFAKRLNMNAAGTLTWSNADGGSSLGTKPSHPQQGFSFAYRRFKSITTISNFVTSDPGNMTTAPGFNGAVDSFGLVTSQSTDTITGLTINLTAGMWQYLQTVAIINDAEDVTYCSTTPTGDTVSLSGCTIPVSTTNTQFKIELTAASHASMPAPPGGLYTMAATVTGWTGTNVTHAGTDSGSGTFTIDNASPNNATALSGSAGNAANTLNWTTSDSADFNSNNGSIVYRWASAFAGSEVPAEGSTPVKGNTNGTATLACVVSAAASTALSRIDGTGGSADCTTTALTNGQAYTYKVFHRDIWGNYNVGVLIGTFTPREPIILAGYTNTAETALNYSAACTNCGARIGGGAAFRQTITITGTGLGTVAAGNRSTATNNIKIGTHQIADANITTWTSTSITFLTDSNVTGDTDADWGVNFGGVDGLTITVDGIVSTGLNFYVFSQVTSVTAPTAVANAAREYAVGDTDGVITLNGTRFGTAATGGWVRIFGCDSTTCSSPSGSATTTSWNNMAITVQVPTVIADNVYTGSLIMQQGAGSSNKSHTYTTTGFRVLPRITSLNPSSGIIGDPVTTNGNHLCQNNGACPSAYDTNNRVTFTSAVNATSLTSWTSTAIATVVPTGTVTGNVFITSNTYTSNNLNFSGLSLVPNDPTAVNQFKDAALTQAISVGGISSSTPLYLTMTMQASVSGGTLYPQIEYKPIGSSFVCGVGACVTAMEGTGKSGPGPVDCAQTASGCAISITPTDNVYHWQARVRHNRGGSDYYSNWVSFGANGENATDFKLDSAGPVISFAGANACADAVTSLSTNSATVSWSTDESATGQIEYSKNSNLSSSALYPVPAGATAFSHSYGLNNLDSDTTYYFRVNSTDAYGNQTLRAASSPFCSFKTSNVTQPAKTVRFYVIGQQTALTGGLLATSSFAVYIPESSVAIKSTFLEINGISPVTGTNNIQVAVNNQSPLTYNIASASNFKLLYKVDPANLNLDPVDNLLSLTPSTNVNIISAKVFVTYSFEP